MPPITPSEVTSRKKKEMPEAVLEVWNTLIAKKASDRTHSARISQKEVVTALAIAMCVSETDVFENHWLDIEEIYREAGWYVKYDKPGYCESYAAYFEFWSKGC